MRNIILLMSLLVVPSVVFSATGDSTVSLGYSQVKSSHLKDLVNGMKPDYDVDSYSGDKYKDLSGMFIRYKYEINESWGIISSLGYANKSFDNRIKDSFYPLSRSKSNEYEATQISLLVGPAFRINEYVSVYGMVGSAYNELKYKFSVQHYENNKFRNGYSYNEKNDDYSIAYKLGAQFDVYSNIVIDASYDRSGSGDWKTDGFSIGAGIKF